MAFRIAQMLFIALAPFCASIAYGASLTEQLLQMYQERTQALLDVDVKLIESTKWKQDQTRFRDILESLMKDPDQISKDDYAKFGLELRNEGVPAIRINLAACPQWNELGMVMQIALEDPEPERNNLSGWGVPESEVSAILSPEAKKEFDESIRSQISALMLAGKSDLEHSSYTASQRRQKLVAIQDQLMKVANEARFDAAAALMEKVSEKTQKILVRDLFGMHYAVSYSLTDSSDEGLSRFEDIVLNKYWTISGVAK